jgi:uncharacterized protein
VSARCCVSALAVKHDNHQEKSMKRIATFIATTSAAMSMILVTATYAQSGELTAEKRANIKTLLEITGVRGIPEQIAVSTVQSMAPGIKQLDPKFPDKGFVVMRDALVAGLAPKVDTAGGLIEQATMIYHNAFTAAEIAEMVKFYQSAVGKKLLSNQAKVNGETMQTAMKWADSMGADLDQRMEAALKKENLKLPDPPKEKVAVPAKNGTGAVPPAKKQ